MLIARADKNAGVETKFTHHNTPEAEIAIVNPPSDQTFSQNILFTAKGGSIAFTGRVFEYIVRFVFSIIVARIIGAEQYGLYTLALTLVPIASMMALLGLQTAVVAFLAPAIREQDDPKIWGIIQICAGIPLLLSILFGTILFLLAEPIATLGFHDPRLVPLLRIASVGIPLEALGFIAYQIIISYKKPQYSVLANNIVLPVTKLLLTVGLLVVGMGVSGIVSAHVFATALGLALIIYFVNSLFPLNRPINPARREFRQLIRYSLPVHLGWVFNTIRGTLEVIVLGFVGLTTGVGIFAVAQRLSSLGTLPFLSIGNIATPLIADFYHQGDLSQLKKLYQTTTKWVVMFNLPLFFFFVIFPKPLLSIFGAEFALGATALVILAVGNLFYTGTGFGANILDMTNHTKFNSANSAFLVVVTIAFDLFLIPRWGVLGAAAASAFSTVIVNVACLIEVFFLLKMHPYRRDVWKPIVAVSISALITLVLNQYLVLPPLLHLLIGGVILWGSYAIVLTLLGLSEEDIFIITYFRSRIKTFVSSIRSIAG